MDERKPSVYMLQLSDGSLRCGLVDKPVLEFTLKMNLLFFEHLYVSAPALLRNHVLFDMSQSGKDVSGLRKVYGGHVRPILIEGNKDIITVADAVVNSDKPIGISDPKRENNLCLIRTHAEFIAKSEPPYFWPASETVGKAGYYSVFKGLVERYNSDGANFWTSPVKPRDLDTFLEKLKQEDPNEFRVADAYDLAKTCAPKTAYKFIQAISFTSKEYDVAPFKYEGFSLVNLGRPIINDYWRVKCGDAFRYEGVTSTDEQAESLSINLPLSDILELSWSEIIEVRDTALFQKLRDRLYRFRKGEYEDFNDDIYAIYAENIDEFRKFIGGVDRPQRKRILKSIEQQKRGAIFKHLGIGVVALLATSWAAVSGGPLPIEIEPHCLFIAQWAASFWLAEMTLGSSDDVLVNPPSLPKDGEIVSYNPASGTSVRT